MREEPRVFVSSIAKALDRTDIPLEGFILTTARPTLGTPRIAAAFGNAGVGDAGIGGTNGVGDVAVDSRVVATCPSACFVVAADDGPVNF
jgi:hypothetical protein